MQFHCLSLIFTNPATLALKSISGVSYINQLGVIRSANLEFSTVSVDRDINLSKKTQTLSIITFNRLKIH